MEIQKKKSERTIIKCADCGFKYYDGDVHNCPTVNIKEATKEPEGPEEKKDSVPEIKDIGWIKKFKKKK